MKPTVQWRGDNLPQVEALLEPFLARVTKEGDKLHLTGVGVDIWVSLGDSLEIDGDAVGIRRLDPGPRVEPMIEWTGKNAGEVANFLRDFAIRIEVVGHDLYLLGRGEDRPVVLNPGDRIIRRRQTQLVISKGGRDHRVS